MFNIGSVAAKTKIAGNEAKDKSGGIFELIYLN